MDKARGQTAMLHMKQGKISLLEKFPLESKSWIYSYFSNYNGGSHEGAKCSKIKGEKEVVTA